MEEVKHLITEFDFQRFQKLQQAYDEKKIYVEVERYYSENVFRGLRERVAIVGADELVAEFNAAKKEMIKKLDELGEENREAWKQYHEMKQKKRPLFSW